MMLRHRLSACAVLAAFLAAQTWIVCTVACLGTSLGGRTPGHAVSPDAPRAMHGMLCHTHEVSERGPLMQQALSPMLTAVPAMTVAQARQTRLAPAAGPQAPSRYPPSADPPPPRFA